MSTADAPNGSSLQPPRLKPLMATSGTPRPDLGFPLTQCVCSRCVASHSHAGGMLPAPAHRPRVKPLMAKWMILFLASNGVNSAKQDDAVGRRNGGCVGFEHAIQLLGAANGRRA